MNIIHLLIKKFDIDYDQLVSLWREVSTCSYPNCKKKIKVGTLCPLHQSPCLFKTCLPSCKKCIPFRCSYNKSCTHPRIVNKEVCKKHEYVCPILIQTGKSKGRPCSKSCVDQRTCKAHQGMMMCSIPDCIFTCIKENQICDMHKNMNIKPICSIRKQDNYYVIKDTSIAIDIKKEVILGIVSENKIDCQMNPEIQFLCNFYQFKFN